EFPVDAARLVAGFVRAVLREFETGAAAPACVLAETVAARAEARAQAQILESRADGGRNQCRVGHRRLNADTQPSAATRRRRRRHCAVRLRRRTTGASDGA